MAEWLKFPHCNCNDSNQIVHGDKDYRTPSRLVQTHAAQIQDGGQKHHLGKIEKSTISQQRFDHSP